MVALSSKPIWLFVALLFLAGLFIQLFIIPQQMDEHGMFHLLACDHYPLSSLNVFTEPCDVSYAVKFANLFTMRYSAPYTGSLMDWLYRPVFAIWPDPYSYFVFTLFFWACCLRLLATLLGIPVGITFLALGMHFAFVYHIGHGASSVPPNIAMLLVPMIAVKAMQTGRPWRYGLLAGLILCLGIEAKMFFFYIIPGIAVLSVAAIWSRYPVTKPVIGSALRFGLLAGLVSAIFAYTLLTSPSVERPKMTHGQRILQYSESFRPGEFGTYAEHLWWNIKLYWGDFGNVLNRVYPSLQESWWSLSGTRLWTLVFWALVIYSCSYAIRLERRQRLMGFNLEKWVMGCALASLVMVLAVGLNKLSWTHHHHFHPIVPMFYAFAASLGALWKRPYLRRSVVPSLAVLLALCSMSSVLIKSSQPLMSKHLHIYEPSNEGLDYDKIVTWLRRPEVGNHVVIYQIGWGMYYTSSLYGAPQQLVVYSYRADKFPWIYAGTRQLNRPYLFITKNKAVVDITRPYFGAIYDITANVLQSTPNKLAIRYLCEPPLPGLASMCELWLASQAYSGWHVYSTIPYDKLMSLQAGGHDKP